MTFRLSKVSPRRRKEADHARRITIVKNEQLFEEVKGLLPLPKLYRRTRKPVPIPSFSPIEMAGDKNVDLSIFDTPPDKNERFRNVDRSPRVPYSKSANPNRWNTGQTNTDAESKVANCQRNSDEKSSTILNGSNDALETSSATPSPDPAPPLNSNPSIVKACNSKPKFQPNQSALKRSVDLIYTKVDISLVTLKDIREAIEAEYEVKLSKANRNLVKDRLSGIINGKVKPGVSSEVGGKIVSSDSTISFPNTNTAIDVHSTNVEAANATLTVAKSGLNTASAISRSDEPKKYPPKSTRDQNIEKLCSEQREDYTPGQSLRTIPTVTTETCKQAALNAMASPFDPSVLKMDTKAESISIDSQVCLLEGGDDDEFEIPGPALSKPPVKPAPSRNRIHNRMNNTNSPNLNITTTATPQRAARKRTRQVSCVLCASCPCQHMKMETMDFASPSVGLARNDREIEKLMIRRVKKLEKTCDKYEGDLDQLNRELKRHRKLMTKKQEMLVNQRKQQKIGGSHFLPDANVWDQHLDDIKQTRVNREVALQAKANMFSIHPNFQPTLTQMIGVRSKKSECDDNGNKGGRNAIEDADVQSSDEGDDAGVEGESVVEYDHAIEQHNMADHVHRLKWNEPTAPSMTQSPLLSRTGRGVWDALKPSTPTSPCKSKPEKYVCAWDRIFVEEDLSGEGVEELLHLFEKGLFESPRARRQEFPLSLVESQVVDLAMLSQSSQLLAKSIESKVIGNTDMHDAVERGCPNWRENVRYSFYKQNNVDINLALKNVRRSRERMESMKEKILAAWDRQQAVLDLYDVSLTESLKRLEEKENLSPLMSQGFFPIDTCSSDGPKGLSSYARDCNDDVNRGLPLSPILEDCQETSSQPTNGYETPV